MHMRVCSPACMHSRQPVQSGAGEAIVSICGSVQVPNEKLMSAELLNMTQSINYQDRLVFEVDTRNVTQATIDDLTDRLHMLMQKQDEGSYFDPHFDSFAHIAALQDPLKYQVCIPSCLSATYLQPNEPSAAFFMSYGLRFWGYSAMCTVRQCEHAAMLSCLLIGLLVCRSACAISSTVTLCPLSTCARRARACTSPSASGSGRTTLSTASPYSLAS